MKYMGSKRMMLQNGLGEILFQESRSASRVVDLFSGSGTVSWFAATHLDRPVEAYDLQAYAAVLANSVIARCGSVDVGDIEKSWIGRTKAGLSRRKGWSEVLQHERSKSHVASWKKSAEILCSSTVGSGESVIWSSYGGHYFSPRQAMVFDALLDNLPRDEVIRTVCLAAVIVAASQCSASPGHTAQPFKATPTAGRYLEEAWLRDPFFYVRNAVVKISGLHATRVGRAHVGDSNQAAKTLKKGDLVFLDPPYSGVHYSRFYHVLETIARGWCGPVSGVGRYPPSEERPISNFSKKGTSRGAMEDLLKTLSERGCRVILTFPGEECSNGLSGKELERVAGNFFVVRKKVVKTRFSTLGGNVIKRNARKVSDELILVLSE